VPYETPAVCVIRSRTGDGPRGRDDGEARVGAHGHRGAGEGRDVARHRFEQGEPPLLDQRHRGHAGERLGLRGDAEHRVRGHAAAGLAVGPPDRALVDRNAVAEHQGDRARDLAAAYRALQGAVDAGEPRHGKAVARGLGGVRVRHRGRRLRGQHGRAHGRRETQRARREQGGGRGTAGDDGRGAAGHARHDAPRGYTARKCDAG
jgi:hypothetical protein